MDISVEQIFFQVELLRALWTAQSDHRMDVRALVRVARMPRNLQRVWETVNIAVFESGKQQRITIGKGVILKPFAGPMAKIDPGSISGPAIAPPDMAWLEIHPCILLKIPKQVVRQVFRSDARSQLVGAEHVGQMVSQDNRVVTESVNETAGGK